MDKQFLNPHIWNYTIICFVGMKSALCRTRSKIFASWGLMKASSREINKLMAQIMVTACINWKQSNVHCKPRSYLIQKWLIIVGGKLLGTFILGYCTFKSAAIGVCSTQVAWSIVYYCSFNRYSLGFHNNKVWKPSLVSLKLKCKWQYSASPTARVIVPNLKIRIN